MNKKKVKEIPQKKQVNPYNMKSTKQTEYKFILIAPLTPITNKTPVRIQTNKNNTHTHTQLQLTIY